MALNLAQMKLPTSLWIGISMRRHALWSGKLARRKAPQAPLYIPCRPVQGTRLDLSTSVGISVDETLEEPVEQPATPYFRVYYNDVYEVPLPPRHRFPMKKYAQVRQNLQQRLEELPKEEKEMIQCEFKVSPLATIEELESTHSSEYIRRFLDGEQTEQEQRNVGFPWSPQGVDRALSSVGGTLAAARSVCDEILLRNPQAVSKSTLHNVISNNSLGDTSSVMPWGAHVAGGTHHAFWDYGEGFSVFSDIAVAANMVLKEYPTLIRKILILDLDVHQGNGNAVLFQGRPEVSTFSMHCQGNYFSKKEKSDLDIELPIGCTDVTYLMTLKHWLKRIEVEGDDFDLIFYQAGVDILNEDRLGRMDITAEDVQKRNEMVYDFAHRLQAPLVISMGGGYPKRNDNWAPILNAHSDVYYMAHHFLRRKALASLQSTLN